MNDNSQHKIISAQEFDGIFTRYYSDLFYYAYEFVEDQEACRDIVADAFSTAWENRTRYRAEAVGSFLYSCVRNKCIDILRHNQAARQYISQIEKIAEEEENISPEEQEEVLTNMKRIIALLPPKTRFVLEQCYFHNKQYSEVAQILEISTNGVKKHIMKAFATLRLHINKKNP